MDSSNGDLDKFIPSESDEASDNGKPVSNRKKLSSHSSDPRVNVAKSDGDDVAVMVDTQSQARARSTFGLLRHRRWCKICAAVTVSLLVIATVSLLVLFFAFDRKSSLVFTRSNATNESWAAAGLGSNSTPTAGTGGSKIDSRIVPQGKGRPFWSGCDGFETFSVVHAVYTKECELEGERCVIYEGSQGIIEVIFTPTVNVSALHVQLRGFVNNLPIPFFGTPKEPNACVDSNLDCPIFADQTYLYRSIEVADTKGATRFFTVNVDSELSLIDSVTGRTIVCVIVPVRVRQS